MMHKKTISEKIHELQILRTKLNRIRCMNAQDLRKLRLQYQDIRNDNDQIDALVARINTVLDNYFANVKE